MAHDSCIVTISMAWYWLYPWLPQSNMWQNFQLKIYLVHLPLALGLNQPVGWLHLFGFTLSELPAWFWFYLAASWSEMPSSSWNSTRGRISKETEEWTNGWPQLMHWFPLKCSTNVSKNVAFSSASTQSSEELLSKLSSSWSRIKKQYHVKD